MSRWLMSQVGIVRVSDIWVGYVPVANCRLMIVGMVNVGVGFVR